MNAETDELTRKFYALASKMKERLDRTKDYDSEEDTLSINLLHEGVEYEIVLIHNATTLAASLWSNGRCLKTVEGEDGNLFVHFDSKL